MAPTSRIARKSDSEPTSGSSLRLRVKGADGRTQVLEFVAASEADALRKAAARGLQVLAVDSQGGADIPIRGSSRPFPLLLFSQELLALLDAGLNLTEALATLQAKERQPAVARVLEAMLASLREGRSFSDVLSSMPLHFPQVYVATVRASERTGDLPQVLARFIAYQQQFETLRKKLLSAAIYPAMLLVVGGFVTLFLLGYVVPRFRRGLRIVGSGDALALCRDAELREAHCHPLAARWRRPSGVDRPCRVGSQPRRRPRLGARADHAASLAIDSGR